MEEIAAAHETSLPALRALQGVGMFQRVPDPRLELLQPLGREALDLPPPARDLLHHHDLRVPPRRGLARGDRVRLALALLDSNSAPALQACVAATTSNGLLPSSARAWMLAPWASSTSTAATASPDAAQCRGVWPPASAALRSAPWLSNADTTPAASFSAAACNGVAPSSEHAERFAPRPSNTCTTRSAFFNAAT